MAGERFDQPFEVVEIDGARGVQAIAKLAGGAEGEPLRLVDAVSMLTRSSKDCAHLEEAHIVHIAVQVVGQHGEHAGNQRRPQHARLFAERVVHGDGNAGLRGKCSCIGGGAEGGGDGLVIAGGKQQLAHHGMLRRMWQLQHRAGEAGQRVGEAVVAVDARDLFDEVDLALEIEPPARQRDGIAAFAVAYKRAAERAKDARGDLVSDAGPIAGAA